MADTYRGTKSWTERTANVLESSRVQGGGSAVYTSIHAKTHEQMAYSVHRLEPDVSNNVNLDLALTVGSKNIHLVWSITTTAAARSYFYENADIAGGTSINALNRDRARGTDNGHVTAVYNPTVNSLGTELTADIIPGGEKNKSIGGAGHVFSEWIIGAGTTCMIRVQNNSGAGEDISINGYYYVE